MSVVSSCCDNIVTFYELFPQNESVFQIFIILEIMLVRGSQTPWFKKKSCPTSWFILTASDLHHSLSTSVGKSVMRWWRVNGLWVTRNFLKTRKIKWKCGVKDEVVVAVISRIISCEFFSGTLCADTLQKVTPLLYNYNPNITAARIPSGPSAHKQTRFTRFNHGPETINYNHSDSSTSLR